MEMKFRAWDKKRKKHYQVLHLHMGSDLWATAKGFDVIDDKDIHIRIQPNDCIIEQYTGQKDKNGKEIYVGDIVEDEYGDFWRVIFNEKNSCYCLQKLSVEYNSYFDDDIKSNTLAVIGNIYERPELTIKLLN